MEEQIVAASETADAVHVREHIVEIVSDLWRRSAKGRPNLRHGVRQDG